MCGSRAAISVLSKFTHTHTFTNLSGRRKAFLQQSNLCCQNSAQKFTHTHTSMHLSGKKQGMPPAVKSMLSKFSSKREEDRLDGYTSFLKLGPKLLKFIPGDKVCTYVCMYACMYVCIPPFLILGLSCLKFISGDKMCMYVRICMYVCICVCVCVCMYVYIYIHSVQARDLKHT